MIVVVITLMLLGAFIYHTIFQANMAIDENAITAQCLALCQTLATQGGGCYLSVKLSTGFQYIMESQRSLDAQIGIPPPLYLYGMTTEFRCCKALTAGGTRVAPGEMPGGGRLIIS